LSLFRHILAHNFWIAHLCFNYHQLSSTTNNKMIYYLCLAYVCVALLTLVISILFGGEKKVAGKNKAARRVTLPVRPAAPTKKPRSEVSWSEQDESAHVRHVWSWACAEEPVSLVEVDDVEMVEVDDVEIVDEHADVVPTTVVEWCKRVWLDNGVWLHRPSILPPILEESFEESTALVPVLPSSAFEEEDDGLEDLTSEQLLEADIEFHLDMARRQAIDFFATADQAEEPAVEPALEPSVVPVLPSPRRSARLQAKRTTLGEGGRPLLGLAIIDGRRRSLRLMRRG
jgi:hypothetical protein